MSSRGPFGVLHLLRNQRFAQAFLLFVRPRPVKDPGVLRETLYVTV